jgi:predicted nucleic acid-binding protein
MIVVDASAILDLLLKAATSKRIRARLFGPGQTIHAPHLIDIEVMQVLRRFWLKGALESDRAAGAIEDFVDMSIERYAHGLLVTRIWELRDNLTAYDASYVALAELLDAPLLTCDTRLARVPGILASIEVAS